MDVAILLFDELTALDAVGPYEVLSRVPDARVRFVGRTTGLVRTGNGMLGLSVDAPLAEVSTTDILVIPGGRGVEALASDASLLGWIRSVHASTQFTTAVCTGSLLLGGAGLLEGIGATTHWAYVDQLEALGALPVRDRVVRSGKVWTSAGVSAGIDMALALCVELGGPALAREIQLAMEYDPQPPFDAGSPKKAKPELVEKLRAKLRG